MTSPEAGDTNHFFQSSHQMKMYHYISKVHRILFSLYRLLFEKQHDVVRTIKIFGF